MFKKFYLVVVVLTGIVFNCLSQSITNYAFAPTTGTFTALVGATAKAGSGGTDESVYNAIPIGFDFWYMGTRYTTISGTSNGWLTLCANIGLDGTSAYFFVNDLDFS